MQIRHSSFLTSRTCCNSYTTLVMYWNIVVTSRLKFNWSSVLCTKIIICNTWIIVREDSDIVSASVSWRCWWFPWMIDDIFVCCIFIFLNINECMCMILMLWLLNWGVISGIVGEFDTFAGADHVSEFDYIDICVGSVHSSYELGVLMYYHRANTVILYLDRRTYWLVIQ